MRFLVIRVGAEWWCGRSVVVASSLLRESSSFLAEALAQQIFPWSRLCILSEGRWLAGSAEPFELECGAEGVGVCSPPAAAAAAAVYARGAGLR